MNKSREGLSTALQVGKYKPVTDLATKNFTLNGAYFQIKNDGDETVFLNVRGPKMDEGDFTLTGFPGGSTWSPEIVIEIKADIELADVSLVWGY